MSTIPPKARAGADIVASVRRSIVGVRSASSGGTGWIVLGNGLVLTSHEAVGYKTDVTLELHGGRRAAGRVIWVDVMRDLALVLPLEQLGLPPLYARPDLPKIGEPGLALSFVPGQPFRVSSVIVSAVDRKIGGVRCFDIDASMSSSGGPIVDFDGRVLGIAGLDLPRGSARRGPTSTERFSPALPITALGRALAAFDVPTTQFQDRAPTYRCPSCTEPYSVAIERCVACGQRLPHAWEFFGAEFSLTPAFLAAERLVRDTLTRLGPAANGVRIGPRRYRVTAPSVDGAPSHPAEVTIEIDPHGRVLAANVQLVRIPGANHEPFYRFLLTLNDQTTRSQRVFVDGDLVHLAFHEQVALLTDTLAAQLVEDLVRSAHDYRKALADAFDAKLTG